MCYQNVRGLRTIVKSFLSSELSRDLDVIVLSETWLNDDIHSTELFGRRFTVYRADHYLSQTDKIDGGG